MRWRRLRREGMVSEMRDPNKEQNALEWYEAMIFALVILVVGFSFFFRIIMVSGSSMEPTLQWNDRLIIRAAGYTPERGDVIVVDGYIDYGKPLVKRIIAMGGDTVDIDFERGEVSVNGQVLDEPYTAAPTYDSFDVEFPLTVPEGTVFVLGDNRNASSDSRVAAIGCIDERDIMGKVVFRFMPVNKLGGIE